MNYSIKSEHCVALNLSLIVSKQGNQMEIIDIITEVLVFGGALLAFTVIFSFYLSKKKNLADFSSHSVKINSIKNNWYLHRSVENESQRKNQEPLHPQIFQIDQSKQLGIRIIPRSSTANGDSNFNTNNHYERPASERNGTARYRIINDEIRKTEEKAVNFYL